MHRSHGTRGNGANTRNSSRSNRRAPDWRNGQADLPPRPAKTNKGSLEIGQSGIDQQTPPSAPRVES